MTAICNLAETSKLLAEAGKFRRDRWIIPLTAFLGLLAAVAALLPELLRAFGVG